MSYSTNVGSRIPSVEVSWLGRAASGARTKTVAFPYQYNPSTVFIAILPCMRIRMAGGVQYRFLFKLGVGSFYGRSFENVQLLF